LLLAAVFAAAGAAKLADLRGSQAALRGFGVPRVPAGIVGVLLPLAELAIAAALFPATTSRYAAAGSLALLVVFTAAIGWALVRGRTPDCHCFGQLHSTPVGLSTLARTAALAGLAALIVSQPVASPTAVELAIFAVIVLVVGQAVLFYKLLRRYGRALERIAELEAGSPERRALEFGVAAPTFSLPAIGGGHVSLESLVTRARPALLVFTDPGCGPCHALFPDLSRWQHEHTEQLTVAVVSRGDATQTVAVAEEHDLETVLVQEDREVAELYGAYALPSAVLIGADGRIGHALVAGASAIEDLVRSILTTLVPTTEAASNGVAKVTTAAALAGGLAAAATAAEASLRDTSQQSPDPELQAIAAILRKAGPRIARAGKRSENAVLAQATLDEDAAQRRKRAAAARAVAAERAEVLALRTELAKLEPVGPAAHSVRVLSLAGLSLLAQSLRLRERSFVVTGKASTRLLNDSQKTLRRSLPPLASAAEFMRRK